MPFGISDNDDTLLGLGGGFVLGLFVGDALPDGEGGGPDPEPEPTPALGWAVRATVGRPGAQPFVNRDWVVFRPPVGSLVELQAVFTDDGTEKDPDTVTVRVMTPGFDELPGEAVQVVRDTVGVYRCQVRVTEQGRYHYLWAGVGTAVDATGAGYWEVPVSPFVFPAG